MDDITYPVGLFDTSGRVFDDASFDTERYARFRTFTDSVVFSDSYNRVWNVYKTFADGITFSETLSATHLDYQGIWLIDWTKDLISPNIINTKDPSVSTIWTRATSANPGWTTSTAATGIWTRAASAKGTWT